MKLLLSKLEKLSPGTAEYLAVLKDVMDHLKPHNDSEEHTDLPMLEKAIGAEESEKAAKSFSRTKMFAPTRSVSVPLSCSCILNPDAPFDLVPILMHLINRRLKHWLGS